MNRYRLENRYGHFKFYELWAGSYVNNETGKADKAFVGTRFGRIGTEGQTKLIEFEGEGCVAEALSFLQKKMREKLSRGYEIIEAPPKADAEVDVASLITERSENRQKQAQITFQMQ